MKYLALFFFIARVGCTPPRDERDRGPEPIPSADASPSAASPPATPIYRGRTSLAGIEFLVDRTGVGPADAKLPLVVSVHGLGDRPERFRLFGGFAVDARIVRPRGLKPYGRGYSWFDIDARRAERVERAGLEHAADRVAALLARLTDVYPTSGRPVLTGFSQGGMIAFAVAVRHPTRIGVAIPLAGWLPVRLVPPGPPSAGAPPIYALHGADDPVLPLLPTMESVKGLRASGFTVDLEVYPATAHTVSPRMRRDLHRKIAEAVSLESAR